MNKKEEKKLCRSVLDVIENDIPGDYANKVLARFPDTPLNTLINVRYGKTFKKDILERIVTSCNLSIPGFLANQFYNSKAAA